MSRLDKLIAGLHTTTFFDDPASTKYHGSYKGGLCEHSHHVRQNLLLLTEKLGLEWGDPESPDIIGMAHDTCKIGAYLPDGNGGYMWNFKHPKGHGDLSIVVARKWIELIEEEVCILWHMGAFDSRANWPLYCEAIQRFPNVLYTHTADMMATHIDEKKVV